MPLLLVDPRTSSEAADRPPSTRSHQLLVIPSPLRLWHLASLDAPTVAGVWSLAFARTANIHLPAWVPLLLALGTWSIYIGDRLLDANSALRAGDLDRLRERHHFHWRHRRVLFPICVVTAAVSAIIIFTRMPPVLRERNSVLAVATLAYLSGVHLPLRQAGKRSCFFSKEFLVGMLFTAGCALPTLSRVHVTTISLVELSRLLASFTFFAMLAWLNCHAIECWESKTSARFALNAFQLSCFGILLSIFFSRGTQGAALLIAGSASALLLGLLDRVGTDMAPIVLRAAADLVLLTPIFLLIR